MARSFSSAPRSGFVASGNANAGRVTLKGYPDYNTRGPVQARKGGTMRYLIVAALVVAVAVPTVAVAATWRPGAPYYIAEEDANRLLERTYDSAFCDGLARFGKRGEFPYEEYVRFDCTTERNGVYCSDARYRSVKAARRGYFRLVLTVKPDCF